jgi:hypothetical protein
LRCIHQDHAAVNVSLLGAAGLDDLAIHSAVRTRGMRFRLVVQAGAAAPMVAATSFAYVPWATNCISGE